MLKILKATCATVVALSAFGGIPIQSKFQSYNLTQPYLTLPITKPEQKFQNKQYMELYALKNSYIFASPTLTAKIIKTLSIGDKVYAYDELRSNNYGSYYVTNEGYIKHSDLTYLKDLVFYPMNGILYTCTNAYAVDLPFDNSIIIETFPLNSAVKVNGYNDNGYYRLIEPCQGFIHKNFLVPQPEVTINNTDMITAQSGVYYYNGRKETYYSSRALYHYKTPEWHLDTEGFYHDKNDYYVVAASDIPFGTVFDCSKGKCIVLDTGCAAGVTDYFVNW